MTDTPGREPGAPEPTEPESTPPEATPEQRAGLQRQLAQSGGADDARAFIAAMRRSMDVDVAEERL